MTDIAIQWDASNNRGVWGVVNGAIGLGADLESAVMISLFTDALAPENFPIPDGTNDRRGVWFDTYEPDLLGSRLWTLARAKKTDDTTLLLQARDFSRECLQWLIDDGVVATVDVRTYWISPSAIGIIVILTSPDQRVTTFKFDWAWNFTASGP